MAKKYNTQLTRQIGEHLLVSKLGRLGIIATPFAGNVPDFDILAADINGKSLPIQVKAINGPSWQFSNVKEYLEIEFEGKKQIVKGPSALTHPDLICVFILLNEYGNDEFYIFEKKFIQEYLLENYKSRQRPKNYKSLHSAIYPKDLKKFKDNWSLIINKLKN